MVRICGFEDTCTNKDCRKCRKTLLELKLKLSRAELITIEDFASCDLDDWAKEFPESLKLAQTIMFNIFNKILKEERKINKKQHKLLL